LLSTNRRGGASKSRYGATRHGRAPGP